MNEYMHQAQRYIGGGSEGSKHEFVINQPVVKDARSKHTNLAAVWIDQCLSFKYLDVYIRSTQVSNFHKTINVALKNKLQTQRVSQTSPSNVVVIKRTLGHYCFSVSCSTIEHIA